MGINLPVEHGCVPNLPEADMARLLAPRERRDFYADFDKSAKPPRPLADPSDDRPEYLRVLFPEPQPQPPRRVMPMDAHGVPHRAVQARLRGLLSTLGAAPEGKRNHMLHWAACRVAEMLTAGELDYPRGAAEALATVAQAIGLDPREVTGTIRSAFQRYGVVL